MFTVRIIWLFQFPCEAITFGCYTYVAFAPIVIVPYVQFTHNYQIYSNFQVSPLIAPTGSPTNCEMSPSINYNPGDCSSTCNED